MTRTIEKRRATITTCTRPTKRRRRTEPKGSLDLQKWLGKTGIEFHWPGYQHMGPGPRANALSVSEVANDLDDRPLPVPNIGQVKAILRHVNPRKVTGVDGVPAWLLKRFHEELGPVVHDIICASILQAKYPTSYKHALVSPVPKVDNPTDINNDFRQISVLPQVAKVLERIQLKLNWRTYVLMLPNTLLRRTDLLWLRLQASYKTDITRQILVVHIMARMWSCGFRCFWHGFHK